MATRRKDVIVIGGSAGSGAVLRALLGALPAGFEASILVATHVPAQGSGFLAENLARHSALPVREAVDGQPAEPGHVYVAAPDRHLLLLGGTVRLGTGPQENMSRPAIDPLFRSAALSCGPQTIGVVLSGFLNDGASGLRAIADCGGTAVVQDPLDAAADPMPLAALEALEAAGEAHVVPGDAIGTLLVRLAAEEAGEAVPSAPLEDLRLEVEIAAGARLGSERLGRISAPSVLSCPTCSGVLSEMKGNGPLRYRCQIGHGFTADALFRDGGGLDEAVQVAMRMMEERVSLLGRLVDEARRHGRAATAELYERRLREYRRYATVLRDAAVTSLRLGHGSVTDDL